MGVRPSSPGFILASLRSSRVTLSKLLTDYFLMVTLHKLMIDYFLIAVINFLRETRRESLFRVTIAEGFQIMAEEWHGSRTGSFYTEWRRGWCSHGSRQEMEKTGLTQRQVYSSKHNLVTYFCHLLKAPWPSAVPCSLLTFRGRPVTNLCLEPPTPGSI